MIADTAADYAIVGKNGDADREYDYETNTETKNYTYNGRGGVPIGNWLTRAVFAAKYAERVGLAVGRRAASSHTPRPSAGRLPRH